MSLGLQLDPPPRLAIPRPKCDEDHVLVVNVFWDDEHEEPYVEFEVEHPRRCKIWYGCTGKDEYLFLAPCGTKTLHAHSRNDCHIEYEIEGVGEAEALFGGGWYEGSEDPKNRYDIGSQPIGHLNDIAQELGRQLLDSDYARVPFGFEFSSSRDYWTGEYDYEIEVWLVND